MQARALAAVAIEHFGSERQVQPPIFKGRSVRMRPRGRSSLPVVPSARPSTSRTRRSFSAVAGNKIIGRLWQLARQARPKYPRCSRPPPVRGLTLRSTRPVPAGLLGRETPRSIMCLAPQASCRHGRVTSNVRRQPWHILLMASSALLA